MKLIPVGLALIFLLNPLFAEATTEEITIKETTRSVLEQLNNNRDRLMKEPGYIQDVVRELIIPHFDFKLMSELVLGSYWKKFDKLQ